MLQYFVEYGGILAYVLGIGALLLGALGLVADVSPRLRVWRILPLCALLLGGLGALLLEEIRLLPHLWLPLSILGIACLACYAVRTAVLAHLLTAFYAWVQKPFVAWAILAAFGLMLTFGLHLVPSADDATNFELGALGQQIIDDSTLKVVATLQGVTDRGRPVPLYAPQITPLTERQLLELEAPVVEISHVKNQLIRLGPPDTSFNCHGWLFLGGQYWIRGQHVSMILEDNGYQSVSTPHVGDLAIFRDHLGNVTHCAVVRGFATGDTPVLEGKWGWGSRFLHAPHAQIYGHSCSYFRTERPEGHRLRLLIDTPEAPSPRVAG